MSARIQIEFQPVGKRVEAHSGESLLDAARLAGIDLHTACGGEGNCGQCRVQVMQGQTSALSVDEEFFLDDDELKQGYRLACCTRALGDVKVHLPRESVISGQRLQLESQQEEIAVEPFVQADEVEIPPPVPADVRSDLTRLFGALLEVEQKKSKGLAVGGMVATQVGMRRNAHRHTMYRAQAPIIRSLPPILRANNWRVNVFHQDGEILGVCPTGRLPLGLAVDLGTTKIAATLVDLQSGRVLAGAGAPNPQISYGEDLISRLSLAGRDPAMMELLAGKVRCTIDQLAGELALQVGVQREQIAQACIVGNTAMTHLLLELPVMQLAMAPYVAACSDPLDVPAAELGLQLAPGAQVHVPATIGGFVGADHVAMILGARIDQAQGITLGVDIGTNTEICLRVPGMESMVSVSCASGPAFEGAHIRDGMRAASGAIEKVRIASSGVELVTIDHEPPVGICGSGILDAIAELYSHGLIGRNGRFVRDHPRLRTRNGSPEFVLAPAKQTGSGKDILVTQEDVNEIMLAKGAIQAGINILLEDSGLPPEAVHEVIVAGAFGSYLNIENALRAGLFPDLPNAGYRQVGNAAAVGARWMLISRSARAQAAQIAQNTRYLELTTYAKFNLKFAQAMYFPSMK